MFLINNLLFFVVIFANNVFEQTENEETNYSRNQIGCRVIETLIPYANDEVLDRYTEAFSSELRPLCSDRFASYVLQALIKTCFDKSLPNDSKDDLTDTKKHKRFVIKISKFLLNNLEDYVNDIYGNHIMRTVFECLSNGNDEEYREIVKEYSIRLTSWPHFKDLPYNEITSGLLQILLESLRKIDMKMLSLVQTKLLEESYAVKSDPNDELLDVFNSKPAMMLLETSLNLSTSEIYSQIHDKCFSERIAVLAQKRETNFTVQKLLNNCKEEDQV